MLVYKEAEHNRSSDVSSTEQAVRGIIDDVRVHGDDAVLNFTERFDGFRPLKLLVPSEQIKAAYNKISDKIVDNMKFAAERIRNFAEHQRACLKELSY